MYEGETILTCMSYTLLKLHKSKDIVARKANVLHYRFVPD